MLPLIDVLFNYTAEHWHTATGVLDSVENEEYLSTLRRLDRQEKALLAGLEGEMLEVFHRYVENRDDTARTDSAIYFTRGLALGLQLASLAME